MSDTDSVSSEESGASSSAHSVHSVHSMHSSSEEGGTPLAVTASSFAATTASGASSEEAANATANLDATHVGAPLPLAARGAAASAHSADVSSSDGASVAESVSAPAPAPAPAPAASPSRGGVTAWRLVARDVAAELVGDSTGDALLSRNRFGETAVQLLAEAGHADAVGVSLRKLRGTEDASPGELQQAKNGALLTAAAHGRADIMTQLLREGANIREKDATGATALHRAAEGGHVDIVQMLLDMGCPIDEPDLLERTPLHLAVQAGAVQVVALLLRHNADLLRMDDLGRNAADLAEAAQAAKTHVDQASLQAIYAVFQDELEAAKRAAMEAGGLEGYDDELPSLASRPHLDAAFASGSSAQELEAMAAATTAAMTAKLRAGGGGGGIDVGTSFARSAGGEGSGVHQGGGGGQDMSALQATAVVTGDADAPITGIDDIDTLLALLLIKFKTSLEQGLVHSYRDIYRVLDTAGDGRCSAGDLATGCLEMGIEIMPHLLPDVMQRMSGRPGAETIACDEFENFCTLDAAAAV